MAEMKLTVLMDTNTYIDRYYLDSNSASVHFPAASRS